RAHVVGLEPLLIDQGRRQKVWPALILLDADLVLPQRIGLRIGREASGITDNLIIPFPLHDRLAAAAVPLHIGEKIGVEVGCDQTAIGLYIAHGIIPLSGLAQVIKARVIAAKYDFNLMPKLLEDFGGFVLVALFRLA